MNRGKNMHRVRRQTIIFNEAIKAAQARYNDEPGAQLGYSIVEFLRYWSTHERNMAMSVRLSGCADELEETLK